MLVIFIYYSFYNLQNFMIMFVYELLTAITCISSGVVIIILAIYALFAFYGEGEYGIAVGYGALIVIGVLLILIPFCTEALTNWLYTEI